MNIENVEKTETNISPQTSQKSQNTKKTDEKDGFEKLVDSVKKKETESLSNTKKFKTEKQQQQQNDQSPFQAYNDIMFKQNLISLNLKDTNLIQNNDEQKLDPKLSSSMFSYQPRTFKLDPMTSEDEKFLKMLSSNTTTVIDKMIASQNSDEVQIQTKDGTNISYKTTNFSKGVFNIVEYAFNSQKPVRVEMTGNSSVILKIDKEGQLSAEFLSSDKAMEAMLKSNIPFLRNKLDSEGVPYKDIYYKDQPKDEQQQRQQRNKGE